MPYFFPYIAQEGSNSLKTKTHNHLRYVSLYKMWVILSASASSVPYICIEKFCEANGNHYIGPEEITIKVLIMICWCLGHLVVQLSHQFKGCNYFNECQSRLPNWLSSNYN